MTGAGFLFGLIFADGITLSGKNPLGSYAHLLSQEKARF